MTQNEQCRYIQDILVGLIFIVRVNVRDPWGFLLFFYLIEMQLKHLNLPILNVQFNELC